MPANQTIRIGILGGWDIVRKAYMPLLDDWEGVEIAGIFSRTTRTADQVASQWHLDFSTNKLDDLIARSMQAAFVLTSNDSHYTLCQRLLEAGIDVFVEKPATEHSQQTQALAELAGQNNRIFMVGFNRRYAPLYRQAKEIFAGRPIRLCVLEKHRTGVRQRDLHQTYLDDIIHQIDLLRYFTGEPRALQTRLTLQDGQFLSAASLAELPGGGTGLVLSSREAGMWQERLTLTGGDLTIAVSAFRELRVLSKDREEIYGSDRAGRWFPQLQERGFVGEIEHFFDCVHNRTMPHSNGYDSVRTQQLVEAMVDKAVINTA
jgi:virulence factor